MIDCKHIPAEMKVARRWVLWRYVVKTKGDKPSKLPYYANGKERGKGGELDDEKDLAQLATLDDVLAVLEKPSGRPYQGIGFALGPDGTGNCWQGIDLDHVREKGLTELAGELPSYVEKSPSGNGVHAIGYGKGFAALGSNVTGIEAYSEKRYFTVTGKVVIGDELCDLSGFVTQRLAPLRKENPPTCFTQRHRGVEVTDTQDSHDTQDSQERKRETHRAPKTPRSFPCRPARELPSYQPRPAPPRPVRPRQTPEDALPRCRGEGRGGNRQGMALRVPAGDRHQGMVGNVGRLC